MEILLQSVRSIDSGCCESSCRENLLLVFIDMCTLLQIIDEQVLCVHGGLSPEVKTLDQVILVNSLFGLIYTSSHNRFAQLTEE